MTAPVQTPDSSSAPAPKVTQTHTWIFVGLTALSSVLSAFSPKIAAYSGAHPTGTLIIAGLASVLGSFMPSALGAGQSSGQP